MTDKDVIKEIKNTWEYQRGLTTDFINMIPEDKWHFTHHEKYAPLSKQFRHMARVYGCYIDAIEGRKMDLSKKKSHYSGDLVKEDIIKTLESMDERFEKVLEQLRQDGLDGFKIDFFGQQMGLVEFSHVMVQHECAHMGIWANYAAFAGFETPKSWQEDWEL